MIKRETPKTPPLLILKNAKSFEYSEKYEMQRPAVGKRKLQNFDEKFEMCDSKWPIRQVPKIVKEAKQRIKNTPTQREREHPVIEVSPKSPCGAISLGRRPSYQRNPKNGSKDEET